MSVRRELESTPDRWTVLLTKKQLHHPDFKLSDLLNTTALHPPRKKPKCGLSPIGCNKKTCDDVEEKAAVSHLSESSTSNMSPNVSLFSHLQRHLSTHTTQSYLFYTQNSVMIPQWRE